jgi:class 3 adenylate cyclase
LIDILWGDTPPANGLGALQTYVSRLRRILDPGQDPGSGAAVLASTPPGYALQLDSGQLDSARFEALVADAHARAGANAKGALRLLTDALGLWRGPALAEFADAEFARAEATRLEGLRLTAAGDRGDLRLALGEHKELIGELEALVELHPLQERPRAQLMVALYRAGRQVDALAAFQEYRRYLAEMGLEPSAELQALETSIVRQDPELAWHLVPGDDRVPASALPEGVLTFLLTDIQDSTALWDTAPSAMAEALAHHEQIVHECVAANGGILVKSKGEGDSTLSVFSQATAAATAAVALQRQLIAEEWPRGIALRTRVGFHTGEAQLRAGDYYGGTLNRAARIRALATGGQILCSRATADLIADALPEGASLVDLGSQQLAGLRRAETIHALLHPDLPGAGPRAFPASTRGELGDAARAHQLLATVERVGDEYGFAGISRQARQHSRRLSQRHCAELSHRLHRVPHGDHRGLEPSGRAFLPDEPWGSCCSQAPAFNLQIARCAASTDSRASLDKPGSASAPALALSPACSSSITESRSGTPPVAWACAFASFALNSWTVATRTGEAPLSPSTSPTARPIFSATSSNATDIIPPPKA